MQMFLTFREGEGRKIGKEDSRMGTEKLTERKRKTKEQIGDEFMECYGEMK